jgi:transcriptional regulator with XRE-family HTH domain
MDLGKAIKNFRKKKGWNQKKLSYMAKISQGYLSTIEKGKKQPSMDKLERIAEALKIPAPFLVFYSIEEADVPEEKKSMYHILHPHLKKMVDKLIYELYNFK